MSHPVKKCIVFVADMPNYEGLGFYGFPEEDGFNDEQGVENCCPIKLTDPSHISKPLFVLDHYHQSQSYASLPGRVFCAGGGCSNCHVCIPRGKDRRPSNVVYCWDAFRNHQVKSTKMNFNRQRCELHVINDELYVTGYPCTTTGGETVFIEKLDKSDGRWTILLNCPPPRVKLNLKGFLCAGVKSKGYILFGSRACEYFYAFTPPNTWTRMDHLPFDPEKVYAYPIYSIIATEKYLLWLNGHNGLLMLGFDHNNGRYFEIDLKSEGILRSDGRDDQYDQFPSLVYVGNDVLGVVWSDVLCIDGPTRCYHCTRFSIYFEAADKPRVKVLSVMRGIGLGVDQEILDAFVVDVPVGQPADHF